MVALFAAAHPSYEPCDNDCILREQEQLAEEQRLELEQQREHSEKLRIYWEEKTLAEELEFIQRQEKELENATEFFDEGELDSVIEDKFPGDFRRYPNVNGLSTEEIEERNAAKTIEVAPEAFEAPAQANLIEEIDEPVTSIYGIQSIEEPNLKENSVTEPQGLSEARSIPPQISSELSADESIEQKFPNDFRPAPPIKPEPRQTVIDSGSNNEINIPVYTSVPLLPETEITKGCVYLIGIPLSYLRLNFQSPLNCCNQNYIVTLASPAATSTEIREPRT